MIKTAITFFVFFIFISSGIYAQDLRLGGGLGYGTVAKNIGINFRSDVKFDKQWSIAPYFNWFFNKKDGTVLRRWNAMNIDGHYYLEVDQTWVVYPIFGMNFATVSEKANDITFSNSDIGINVGFGSEYKFDSRLAGFGEIKYVISKVDQAVLTLGLLYQITPE